MRAALLALALAACGSKPAPSVEPRETTSPIEASPAAPASDGGAAPSTSSDHPSCPQPDAFSAAIGAPCSPEEAFCGSERCRTAKGFCNLIVCSKGVWKFVEVPPPAPPR